ncbi:MAG: hypothetical protein U1C18_02145, partial [Patescibacteria group bacterium]|nr:hypothetical protein [Patescibacteria group bacterium]
MTDAVSSAVHWEWISPTMPPPKGLNTALVEERPVKASQKPVRSCYHLWSDREGRWVPEGAGGSHIPDEGLRVGHVRHPGKFHAYYIAVITVV